MEVRFGEGRRTNNKRISKGARAARSVTSFAEEY